MCFPGYSYHKQFFLFIAFASIISAPPLRKILAAPLCVATTNQIWKLNRGRNKSQCEQSTRNKLLGCSKTSAQWFTYARCIAWILVTRSERGVIPNRRCRNAWLVTDHAIKRTLKKLRRNNIVQRKRTDLHESRNLRDLHRLPELREMRELHKWPSCEHFAECTRRPCWSCTGCTEQIAQIAQVARGSFACSAKITQIAQSHASTPPKLKQTNKKAINDKNAQNHSRFYSLYNDSKNVVII